MAVIQNQKIIQKLIDELELYPALDKIPTELADKILPTFQVNTEEITVSPEPTTIVRNVNLIDSDGLTTKTIYTTSSSEQFYLTGIALDLIDWGTSTADASISVIIGGVTQTLVKIDCAQTATYNPKPGKSITWSFQNPIKIDKGTIIAVNRDTADTSLIQASVIGYQ